MKDAVFQAIRSDWKFRHTSLARELQRRDELKSKLVDCDNSIARQRQALAQLAAFAHAQGWTEEDLA